MKKESGKYDNFFITDLYLIEAKGMWVFMAGIICPRCRHQTFFQTGQGRKCTNCNYSMYIPANNGKGGRGKKCSNCGKLTVFDGRCRNCGAAYK